MTRAHQDAHWSGAPSLSQLWLAALLRLVAMLVSKVAATVRMIASVLSGECHAEVDPAGQPEPKRDPIEETNLAAPHSETDEALMVSSARSACRVYPELVEGSNHGRAFTTAAFRRVRHGDEDAGLASSSIEKVCAIPLLRVGPV